MTTISPDTALKSETAAIHSSRNGFSRPASMRRNHRRRLGAPDLFDHGVDPASFVQPPGIMRTLASFFTPSSISLR